MRFCFCQKSQYPLLSRFLIYKNLNSFQPLYAHYTGTGSLILDFTCCPASPDLSLAFALYFKRREILILKRRILNGGRIRFPRDCYMWYNNRKAANPSGDHLFPNTIMRRRENESWMDSSMRHELPVVLWIYPAPQSMSGVPRVRWQQAEIMYKLQYCRMCKT